jgi:glycosyltransferase involved in cell wall biosynthesis
MAIRGTANLDVVMLAQNEAVNLPHSLPAVVGWARQVFVVDGGSTDETPTLCRDLGAAVVDRPWLGYARQKNWALDHLPLEADWVLIVDADEKVLPDLHDAIDGVVSRPVDGVHESGYLVNRYFVFLGQRIRHCGYYPSYNLRLFKRGRARYEEREVHEHMIVDGPTGYLDGHLEHYDRRGLEAYMAKHNRYSTLEAREIHAILADAQRHHISSSFFGDPLERRRWIKEYLYPRLPAKWLFRFGFMYLLRGGILDGKAGLEFCLFMSAYELLIELKLKEIGLESAPISGQRA